MYVSCVHLQLNIFQFVPAFKIKQYKTKNDNNLRETRIYQVAKSLGFSKTTRRGSLLAASRGRLDSNEAVSTNVKCFLFFFEGGRVKYAPPCPSLPPSSAPPICVQSLSFSFSGPTVPTGGERREAPPPEGSILPYDSAPHQSVPLRYPSMHLSLPERGGWQKSL